MVADALRYLSNLLLGFGIVTAVGIPIFFVYRRQRSRKNHRAPEISADAALIIVFFWPILAAAHVQEWFVDILNRLPTRKKRSGG